MRVTLKRTSLLFRINGKTGCGSQNNDQIGAPLDPLFGMGRDFKRAQFALDRKDRQNRFVTVEPSQLRRGKDCPLGNSVEDKARDLADPRGELDGGHQLGPQYRQILASEEIVAREKLARLLIDHIGRSRAAVERGRLGEHALGLFLVRNVDHLAVEANRPRAWLGGEGGKNLPRVRHLFG